MSYALNIDPIAQEQIAALPQPALAALAEAFSLPEVVPWSGLSLNERNPDAEVRQLPFGDFRITYLVLEDLRRVDDRRALGGEVALHAVPPAVAVQIEVAFNGPEVTDLG